MKAPIFTTLTPAQTADVKDFLNRHGIWFRELPGNGLTFFTGARSKLTGKRISEEFIKASDEAKANRRVA